MFNRPENSRAFIISRHELENDKEQNKSFLYSCYLRFKDLVKPKHIMGSDLVLLWEEDHKDLWDNYRRDQFHTMSELYEHRHALFYALCKIYDNYITPIKQQKIRCYKSKQHHPDNDPMYEDSFIVWIEVIKFTGDPDIIAYHYPLNWWDKFNLMEMPFAPKYDGYSSDDVIERLLRL